MQTISRLAESITKTASRQTYYTIRYLVDRERVPDAYRAYAYFRWVDDILDTESASETKRSSFVARQRSLLESCYHGVVVGEKLPQEQMLVDLVCDDTEKHSGLHSYLFNMMAVMQFDAERRQRLITHTELNDYTHCLATAVTEAMHYFIGHDCPSPRDQTRVLAVSAAHITHMLRDTFDDVRAGYFNIPLEVLETNHIAPQDVTSEPYRNWVRSRVLLARKYFKAGGEYLRRVDNARCQFAGFAYRARFSWLLDIIEREGFLLRPAYDERRSFVTGIRMAADTLISMFDPRLKTASARPVSIQERRS